MPDTPYQALPPPLAAPQPPAADQPVLPAHHAALPPPADAPWPLKALASATWGDDELPDGRRRLWIRHQVLQGVTPAMLAWWFAHLEGDVLVDGRRINRYRLWHPYDHVHASYARRRPDGTVGPGAAIRLREVLGRDPRYLVNVVTEIEKLDEEGFIHNPVVHGLPGLARMEYQFHAVPGGTLYENCLIVGARGRAGRLLRPLVRTFAFPQDKGLAWVRHNVEEVGQFERFLPALYRQETGLDG